MSDIAQFKPKKLLITEVTFPSIYKDGSFYRLDGKTPVTAPMYSIAMGRTLMEHIINYGGDAHWDNTQIAYQEAEFIRQAHRMSGKFVAQKESQESYIRLRDYARDWAATKSERAIVLYFLDEAFEVGPDF